MGLVGLDEDSSSVESFNAQPKIDQKM